MRSKSPCPSLRALRLLRLCVKPDSWSMDSFTASKQVGTTSRTAFPVLAFPAIVPRCCGTPVRVSVRTRRPKRRRVWFHLLHDRSLASGRGGVGEGTVQVFFMPPAVLPGSRRITLNPPALSARAASAERRYPGGETGGNERNDDSCAVVDE
jgi:hypothetical protein